ncbi:cilia- and flagella-associated protein [Cocos nucifera]|uniref:Cilia- and flagella-associated protein n=1 Tax=Cocos nucifera TaxID=13894 RepID=A0A8K0N3K8_COCNU|nr:cilia- and flagella-associated protein [Cocos nucifera]
MMRQVSSRNQRSKGFRVKNALQLCLLAAVCFWLLYQLKHSYDKKRALEENNLHTWDKLVENQPEFKLGRKDPPRGEENVSRNETHDKEEENEEIEEEEQDQETRQALEDDEARGDGDDEIDEQDQERGDEQEDQERADDEAEIGEELTNEEDKDGQGEETEQLDEQDSEEDSSHKAREESYRRDDVSSAVRRESQAKNSDDEDGDVAEKIMETMEGKDVDTDDMADGADDGSKGNGHSSVRAADASKDNVTGTVLVGNETRWNDHPSINDTVIEKKGSEVGLNNSEGSLTSNQIESWVSSTTASVTNNHVEAKANSTAAVSSYQKIETGTNSTMVDSVANSVPLPNETVGRDLVQSHNITVEMEASKEDKINLKNVVTEGQAERFNTAAGQEDAGERSSVSLGVNDHVDAIRGESTDSSHKMVTKEERDAHIDLQTLPDMQNEAKSMGDEAAE